MDVRYKGWLLWPRVDRLRIGELELMFGFHKSMELISCLSLIVYLASWRGYKRRYKFDIGELCDNVST
jgi:hypothetical protein